ncbi:unnamed protein product, partial [Iphiclides podalirius]
MGCSDAAAQVRRRGSQASCAPAITAYRHRSPALTRAHSRSPALTRAHTLSPTAMSGGERELRRWPGAMLRRGSRRLLRLKYRVPPAALPLDIDDTVSCFCRCAAQPAPLPTAGPFLLSVVPTVPTPRRAETSAHIP